MSRPDLDDAEWSDPANWRAGMFYFSRRDSRAIVPKRHALMGVTVNFARPLGIAIVVAIVGVVALLAAL